MSIVVPVRVSTVRTRVRAPSWLLRTSSSCSSVTPSATRSSRAASFPRAYAELILCLPNPGMVTYESRGSDTAMASLPSLGTRTKIRVSVFSAPSATPAFSLASMSSGSGLPWASVRLSIPTRRMSR